jgi:hypothetical protein
MVVSRLKDGQVHFIYLAEKGLTYEFTVYNKQSMSKYYTLAVLATQDV